MQWLSSSATGRATVRRPREMRDITVPIGTSSIFAISAYENSSTSRIQTAWRNTSGNSSSAARRSPSSVFLSRSCSGVSFAAEPSAAASASSRRVLSTSTASRPASRTRFLHVLCRIVESQALRFVPGSNLSEKRNALTSVSCTRSSASARFRVSLRAVAYSGSR